jgi:hypothetical protein
MEPEDDSGNGCCLSVLDGWCPFIEHASSSVSRELTSQDRGATSASRSRGRSRKTRLNRVCGHVIETADVFIMGKGVDTGADMEGRPLSYLSPCTATTVGSPRDGRQPARDV